MKTLYIPLLLVLASTSTSSFAAFNKDQITAWQNGFLSPVHDSNDSITPHQRQLAQEQLQKLSRGHPLTPENLFFSKNRIATIKSNAMRKINDPTYNESRHVYQHCAIDIRLYCALHNQNYATVKACLKKNTAKLSVECHQSLLHSRSGNKTIGTLLFHDISIPEGSIFYRASQQKVGVSLSRPTIAMGVTVKRNLEFWLNGPIASFTPASNVTMNGLTLASNLPVLLFNNGEIQSFYSPVPMRLSGSTIPAETRIYRKSTTDAWAF